MTRPFEEIGLETLANCQGGAFSWKREIGMVAGGCKWGAITAGALGVIYGGALGGLPGAVVGAKTGLTTGCALGAGVGALLGVADQLGDHNLSH